MSAPLHASQNATILCLASQLPNLGYETVKKHLGLDMTKYQETSWLKAESSFHFNYTAMQGGYFLSLMSCLSSVFTRLSA